MYKRTLIITFIVIIIMLSGCENKNYPTLYIFEEGHVYDANSKNKFSIVDSQTKLLEIKNSIKDLSFNADLGYGYNYVKEEFKKNEIGYVNKVYDFKFLFDDDSNLDEWFKDNKLIFCTVTTTSSGYQAEVYIKKSKDNKTILVLDNFINFKGVGDDEIKTYNFFVSITSQEVNNLTITLDNEEVNFDS